MRVETFDRWYPRITLALMFLGGMAIMGWETVIDHADRQWLILGAVSMMIPQAARSLQQAFGKLAEGAPADSGSSSTPTAARPSSSGDALTPSPGTPNGKTHPPTGPEA